MAVEIKELVIRAIITQTSERGKERAPPSKLSDDSCEERALDHETIVREAVKEVLRILKAAKER